MAAVVANEPLPSLHHVYAKWENRGPWTSGRSTRGGGDTFEKQYRQVTDSGKQAWRNKFGDVGPAPVRRSRYQTRNKRKDQAPLSIHKVSGSTLGHFKVYPTIPPVVGRVRPLMGRCCSCVPNSKESLYDDMVKDIGMRNILRLPSSSRDFISRHCPIIAHTLSRPLNHFYPDVTKNVLCSQRVTEAIQITAEEEADLDNNILSASELAKMLHRRAKRTLNNMKAAISNKLKRLTGWFLHRLLGRLLSSILVHNGQMKMLKKAAETGRPIIYLPCHRSHLDYILLTFIVYHWDIKSPHVAAGDNLNITFFGRLMKGLGGFFIRRTLDKSGRKDLVYRAILHTYMEELLCRGQDFEFFIEGTRSRSGKMVYPKGGLLSIIVDSYNEGKIDDAYIVPVSISYERILDGHFNREQMGESKHAETFWRACVAIWNVYRSKFGNVRVDFSQPFSLKEYLQVAQSFNGTALDCSTPVSLMNSQTSLNSHDDSSLLAPQRRLSPCRSDSAFYGTDIVVEDMRATIQGLADHVVYGQTHAQAVMSTHLLAFTLLTKHRQGGTMQEIAKSFDWLKVEIVNKKRDLGFMGKTRDVMNHACAMLKDAVHVTKASTKSSQREEGSDIDADTCIITPDTSLPRVFQLYYYANNVTTVFALESVLANAIYAVVEPDSWTNQGFESAIEFSHNDIIQQATYLAQLLKYEFMLKPPCMDWEGTFTESIESFLAADMIRNCEEEDDTCGTHEKNRYRSLALSLSCADESDEEQEASDTVYRLNETSHESMERFWFTKRVLAPFIECYHVTACNLVQLLDNTTIPEKEFVNIVHATLKKRAFSGAAQSTESASLDCLKNCLRAFEHLKILECKQRDSTKQRIISLNRHYADEESLNDFILRLQAYRSL